MVGKQKVENFENSQVSQGTGPGWRRSKLEQRRWRIDWRKTASVVHAAWGAGRIGRVKQCLQTLWCSTLLSCTAIFKKKVAAVVVSQPLIYPRRQTRILLSISRKFTFHKLLKSDWHFSTMSSVSAVWVHKLSIIWLFKSQDPANCSEEEFGICPSLYFVTRFAKCIVHKWM